MKLIDLLVQELPKRGGWPEGYNVISTNGYGQVRCYSIKSEGKISGKELYIRSSEEGRVTREQYEAALAASQKVEWDGEGLPPVGCECEFMKYERGYHEAWRKGTILYASAHTVVIDDYNPGEIVGHPRTFQFRPIRSETDKKRDEAITKITDAIRGEIPDTGMATAAKYAVRAYDAIASGEIPHIRIE